MARLKSGDEAPSFSLLDQDGNTVSTSDFKGRKLLAYFYPRADTPGCTTQSCEVRDAREDLATLGVDPPADMDGRVRLRLEQTPEARV